jgi:putative salt-induced outer membrane protein YdiY
MNRVFNIVPGVALLTAFFSPILLAEEAEDKAWAIAAELGVISTSGNTETTSIQGKIAAKQQLTHWHNEYIFSALFKEDQITEDDGSKTTEKTAEKYFGSIKSAYQLEKEQSNLFVYASHADDQFGAYSKYSTVSLGYGTRLYNSDNMQLDAEIGPGYFRGERVVQNEATPEDDEIIQVEQGAMVRGAASFAWQISTSAEFKQTLSVESGQDNTRTVAESSLTTKINGSLQMKVGFNVTNDSEVAEDKKKTDTMTYVNLVYSF